VTSPPAFEHFVTPVTSFLVGFLPRQWGQRLFLAQLLVFPFLFFPISPPPLFHKLYLRFRYLPPFSPSTHRFFFVVPVIFFSVIPFKKHVFLLLYCSSVFFARVSPSCFVSGSLQLPSTPPFMTLSTLLSTLPPLIFPLHFLSLPSLHHMFRFAFFRTQSQPTIFLYILTGPLNSLSQLPPPMSPACCRGSSFPSMSFAHGLLRVHEKNLKEIVPLPLDPCSLPMSVFPRLPASLWLMFLNRLQYLGRLLCPPMSFFVCCLIFRTPKVFTLCNSPSYSSCFEGRPLTPPPPPSSFPDISCMNAPFPSPWPGEDACFALRLHLSPLFPTENLFSQFFSFLCVLLLYTFF